MKDNKFEVLIHLFHFNHEFLCKMLMLDAFFVKEV